MRTYDLEYLKRQGRTSSLQGIMEAGKTWGYVSMKPKWGRWEWKHSEMNVRHLAYRHINRPLPSNSQLLTTLQYDVTTGSLKQGKEATGKHVYRAESVTECPSFYDRNMISGKAKRKRASLTHRTAPKRPTFASIVDGWQHGVEPYTKKQECIHDANELGTFDNVTGICWVCGEKK